MEQNWNKKVLIFTASTGQGHNAVAESLRVELKKEGYQVCVMEPIKEKSEQLGKMVDDGYRVLATKIPFVYSGLYKISNLERLDNTMNRVLVELMDKTMLEIIETYEPALIITTHPLLVKPISDLIEEGIIKSKFLSVITDFQAHQAYFCDHVDGYIVGCEHTKANLTERGIDEAKIYVYGIPIRRDFTNVKYVKQSDKFTVLIMGGSMGVRGMKKAFKQLLKINQPIKIMAVCASNENLKESLTEIKEQYEGECELEIYGFVQNINKLMAAADVIVTKPGGLTVTEALNMKVPMIIPYYIPGQEEENTEIMSRAGVAIKTETKDTVAVIKTLLNQPGILEYMRANIEKMTANYSIDNTISLCIQLIQSYNEQE